MDRQTGAREGFAKTTRVSVAVAAICGSLLAACGGGGGSNDAKGINNDPPALASTPGTFAFSSDNYGMENPSFLCASGSSLGLVLRAAVASALSDPDFRTVARIDITNTTAVAPNTSYSLGSASQGMAFPGQVYFFNGHSSTMLQTVGGTITFTSVCSKPGSTIAGSFSAQVQDNNDSARPVYTIAASFSFTADGSGPVTPAQLPIPAIAAPLYSANCASCHSLGSLDPSKGSDPELSLLGGQLDLLFPSGTAGHNGMTLTSDQLAALKILLNVY